MLPHRLALAVLLTAPCFAACARSAEAPADESDYVGGSSHPLPEAGSADAGAVVSSPDAGNDTSTGEDAGTADAGSAQGEDAGSAAGSDGGARPGDAGADGGAATSECVAGNYKGEFTGSVQFLPTPLGALLDVNIQGTLEITVQAATQGDVLVAKNGKVHGTDQDGNPVDADLTGSLDCATKKLVNGKLVNGKYTRASILTTSFSGTVEGVYLAKPPSASGTWKTSAGFLEGGGGSWNAALVP
jgi:hypothetical protein